MLDGSKLCHFSHTGLHSSVYNGAVFLILTEVNGNCQIETEEYLLCVKAQMARMNAIEIALLSSGLRVHLIW
jgi:hypothetical protein